MRSWIDTGQVDGKMVDRGCNRCAVVSGTPRERASQRETLTAQLPCWIRCKLTAPYLDHVCRGQWTRLCSSRSGRSSPPANDLDMEGRESITSRISSIT